MGYAQTPDSGRRLARLTFVVLLHAAAIYLILQHSAKGIVEIVPRPLETKLIEEVKPPAPKPPPPAAPKLAAPPPPYIPLPEVRVLAPAPPPPPVSVVTNEKPAQSAPPAASGTVQGSSGTEGTKPHVPVRVAAARECAEKPVYPPASKRANETGTVLVSFLVDVDGRVLDSRVDRSSGYHRLDEASRNAYRLCRFKAATVDGQPQRSWTTVEYVWRLE